MGSIPGHVTKISHATWCSQKKKIIYIYICIKTQLCLTLCEPIDGSPPGSSVHGILQARILDWVAMSSSRGSSQPRDRSRSPAVHAHSLHLSHQGSTHTHTHTHTHIHMALIDTKFLIDTLYYIPYSKEIMRYNLKKKIWNVE